MAKKEPQELRREIKELVAQVTRISKQDLKEDARFFEDLGIDSMMALEIAAGIEKKYRVVIPEDDLPRLRSLNDVYALAEKIVLK